MKYWLGCLMLVPCLALAHGGRLAKDGCHRDSRTNTRHCHGDGAHASSTKRVSSRSYSTRTTPVHTARVRHTTVSTPNPYDAYEEQTVETVTMRAEPAVERIQTRSRTVVVPASVLPPRRDLQTVIPSEATVLPTSTWVEYRETITVEQAPPSYIIVED